MDNTAMEKGASPPRLKKHDCWEKMGEGHKWRNKKNDGGKELWQPRERVTNLRHECAESWKGKTVNEDGEPSMGQKRKKKGKKLTTSLLPIQGGNMGDTQYFAHP